MIEILVDRLRWPAAMVRERAASQLGKLILDDYPGVRSSILDWMRNQQLESLAAIGFLPFIHAASNGRDGTEFVGELETACQANSILSELYLNHLDPSREIRPATGRHSETPPSDWEKQVEYSGTALLNVEKQCRWSLGKIEGIVGVTLARTFDHEVEVLRDRHGDTARDAYRLHGRRQNGFHPGWQTIAHEIRASAFLRTLAWTASNTFIPDEILMREAASISRIDIGLWNVRTSEKPVWWPDVQTGCKSNETEIDTSELIRDVEAAIEALVNNSQVLLAAGGSIGGNGSRRHNLEIRAFSGPLDNSRNLTNGQLFEGLVSVTATVSQTRSPIGFGGLTKLDAQMLGIDSSFIVPMSGKTRSVVPNIWQAWRGIRGIQCPTHLLTEGDLSAVCGDDSINFIGRAGIVAQWSDWTSGVSSLFESGPMPANGWKLVARADIVNTLIEESRGRMAWAWQLKSHHKPHLSREFTETEACGMIVDGSDGGC